MPPAKAFKTERTHEENQERAYIAASRRNDRSLESRLESARRASDIHKRRTGRSLKITEENVTNDGMYEEEYDTLPTPYRGVLTRLHARPVDFDNGPSTYSTTYVATTGDVEQAVYSPYAQQHPRTPQYAYTSMSQSSSPMPSYEQRQQMIHQLSDPSNYRQCPYSTPEQPPQTPSRQSSQHGSASISARRTTFNSPQGSPMVTDSYAQRLSLAAPGDSTSLVESPTSFSTLDTPLRPSPLFLEDSFAVQCGMVGGSMPPSDTTSPSNYSPSLFGTTVEPISEILHDPAFDINGPPTRMTATSVDTSNLYYDFDIQPSNNTEIGICHPYLTWDDFEAAIATSPLDPNIQYLEDNGLHYNSCGGTDKG